MRAKELRQRKIEDLRGMATSLREELFGYRVQNFASRLDKTSQIPRTRKDLARVLTQIRERELKGATDAPSEAAAAKTEVQDKERHEERR